MFPGSYFRNYEKVDAFHTIAGQSGACFVVLVAECAGFSSFLTFPLMMGTCDSVVGPFLTGFHGASITCSRALSPALSKLLSLRHPRLMDLPDPGPLPGCLLTVGPRLNASASGDPSLTLGPAQGLTASSTTCSHRSPRAHCGALWFHLCVRISRRLGWGLVCPFSVVMRTQPLGPALWLHPIWGFPSWLSETKGYSSAQTLMVIGGDKHCTFCNLLNFMYFSEEQKDSDSEVTNFNCC